MKRAKCDDTISKLKYHIREEVKELLNIQKQNRKDWRGVASRMDVKSSTIEKIEKDFKEDPTEKLLEEISDKKIIDLLKVLCEMNRHDVLNIFYEETQCKKSRILR